MHQLFLKLKAPPLLEGQLRLLLSNMGGSVVSAVVFITVLAWRLQDSVETKTVVIWWLATITSSVLCWQHARYHLQRGWSPDNESRIVWQSCFLNGLDGCLWGLLTWLAFGSDDTQLQVIVVATRADCDRRHLAPPTAGGWRQRYCLAAQTRQSERAEAFDWQRIG